MLTTVLRKETSEDQLNAITAIGLGFSIKWTKKSK